MHSLHNSLLTFLAGATGLLVAAVVAWTGWFIMAAFIIYLIYREKQWLVEHLREEVSLGVITQLQYQSICSVFGQSRARFSAIPRGRYRDINRFFQLCGELSHKKRQYIFYGDEQGNQQIIQTLRAELSRLSPRL